jgi:hypothetical protein
MMESYTMRLTGPHTSITAFRKILVS